MKIILASTVVFFLVLCPMILTVRAQTPPNSPPPNIDDTNQYPYARFSPQMAVIIVVLIAALFFMGFFSIYIRHCSDSSSSGGGSIRRALSMRARRAAAARGLDASVIQGFPTFTYAEVKDHQIGKGVLECAVCLNEFQDEETLRLLPKCDHVFHPQCIDAWLESHVTCPVCRANLAPQEGEDEPVQQVVNESTAEEPVSEGTGTGDQSLNRTGSVQQNDQFVVIQINDDDNINNNNNKNSQSDNNSSFEFRNRSVKRSRMFGFGKFRSHSTGHDSLIQPGENLDRFTLRLPAEVRKEVINRAALNRAKSFGMTTLPREGSSRQGYRNGGETGSRTGRFYRRMDRSDGAARSDRWVFFTRAFSMRSPRVVAETSEGTSSGTNTVPGSGSKRSGSIGRTPVKMPSFKCLEPSVNNGDEISLVSKEPSRSDPV